MALGALQYRERLRELTEERVDDFIADIQAEQDFIQEQRDVDLERVDDANAAAELNEFYEVYGRFLDLSQSLARIDREVGFSRQSGLRGNVVAAGEELRVELDFLSMIRTELTAMRDAEVSFLTDADDAV